LKTRIALLLVIALVFAGFGTTRRTIRPTRRQKNRGN